MIERDFLCKKALLQSRVFFTALAFERNYVTLEKRAENKGEGARLNRRFIEGADGRRTMG